MKKIVKGNYSAYLKHLNHKVEVGSLPEVLPENEIIELIERAQAGDEFAFNRITECNLRLVYFVAQHYNYPSNYFSIKDLINEGYFGLVYAVKHFRNIGAKFSSYAFVCIQGQIVRFLHEQLPTHSTIPVFLKNAVSFLKNKRQTEYELLDVEEIHRLLSVKFKSYNQESLKTQSENVEMVINGLKSDTIQNYLAQDKDIADETLIQTLPIKDSCDELMYLFNFLTTKERIVLQLLFGIRQSKEQLVRDIIRISNNKSKGFEKYLHTTIQPHLEFKAEDIGYFLGFSSTTINNIRKNALARLKLLCKDFFSFTLHGIKSQNINKEAWDEYVQSSVIQEPEVIKKATDNTLSKNEKQEKDKYYYVVMPSPPPVEGNKAVSKSELKIISKLEKKYNDRQLKNIRSEIQAWTSATGHQSDSHCVVLYWTKLTQHNKELSKKIRFIKAAEIIIKNSHNLQPYFSKEISKFSGILAFKFDGADKLRRFIGNNSKKKAFKEVHFIPYFRTDLELFK